MVAIDTKCILCVSSHGMRLSDKLYMSSINIEESGTNSPAYMSYF